MTPSESHTAIRRHVEDGLSEQRKLEAELPVATCRALETVGYLSECLRQIKAELDHLAAVCEPVKSGTLGASALPPAVDFSGTTGGPQLSSKMCGTIGCENTADGSGVFCTECWKTIGPYDRPITEEPRE